MRQKTYSLRELPGLDSVYRKGWQPSHFPEDRTAAIPAVRRMFVLAAFWAEQSFLKHGGRSCGRHPPFFLDPTAPPDNSP